MSLLQELPGIGKKQANLINREMPFKNAEDFVGRTGKEELLPYIGF
jgi:DNA uptake protein ComE-like DNA-binding protein